MESNSEQISSTEVQPKKSKGTLITLIVSHAVYLILGFFWIIAAMASIMALGGNHDGDKDFYYYLFIFFLILTLAYPIPAFISILASWILFATKKVKAAFWTTLIPAFYLVFTLLVFLLITTYDPY